MSTIISNPKLWAPGVGNLYDLTVSACSAGVCDAVSSYVGMRTVSLLPFTVPATQPTGPQAGIDRSGQDFPGMPVTSTDVNACWGLCNTTSGCMAWSFGIPSCGNDPANGQCWIKTGVPGTSAQPCRVSGVQGTPAAPGVRPAINGVYTFLMGVLDQAYMPDALYSHATDAAMLNDLTSTTALGFNTIRLHQKVQPQRWYWYTDSMGIVVLQDAVQKYGGATPATIPYFMADLQVAMDTTANHPSRISTEVWNEEDCEGQWNSTAKAAVVAWVAAYDRTRLVDTDSGGPGNDLGIGDFNDVHTYPNPGPPATSATQVAMVGEFFGVGAFVPGHEWVVDGCYAYETVATPADEASVYIGMAQTLLDASSSLSVAIATQITDVEEECDGFLTYDRFNKFNATQVAAIRAANLALLARAAAAAAV